ncbi:MAG: class I SAM-dependent methyltransferase [Chloroflexota bacterium]|nr:class I SAM-dependent methyltransferase [Chloroflexota bacterium]
MNNTSTPARYNEFADFYEAFAPDIYEDPAIVALLSLVSNVSGLRLLDLACGHGRMARELARRGAQVIGLDISEALLSKARNLEQAEPLGIAYIQADAASPYAMEGELFDGVICHFGLSDVDNLDGALATVARVLSPSGFFVFSILHPCFPGSGAKGTNSSWPADQGYFHEGWWLAGGPPGGLRSKVGANHRTLSTYLNMLISHSLVIEEVAEPQAPSALVDVALAADPVPVYLVVRCRKRQM